MFKEGSIVTVLIAGALWKSEPCGYDRPASMSLLLPFLSSLLYVVGILFLKEAAGRGAGVWHTTVVTNVIAGVTFNALWLLPGALPEAPVWGQPALVGLLFLVGQLFGFLAIQHGDVSVATPVMGLKVVLVALFVTLLLGERIPGALWAAALLSSAGIVCLGRGGRGAKSGGPVAPAILFGMLASAAFALFDVLVQKWSPAWGAGRFLPVMMGFTALYSLLLAGILHRSIGRIPPPAWRPLLCGGGFIAIQALGFIGGLALYGRATSSNVVYSARGLWSVLAVWGVGHWFGNREREQGSAAFRGRLIGAGLLMAAILLAVLV